MPERRHFQGQKVKNAKRVLIRGKPFIRVTFTGQKGIPGKQVLVTPEDYDAGIQRTFQPGKTASQKR